jgi:Ca2+/H+ antiporter, TMEM165/GDT1 family
MFEAFTKGLLAITLGELGDKTFFIALILAMRNSRKWVFTGVIGALATMTIISVLMGVVVEKLLPPHYVKWAEIALFLGFGFKLLYDGRKMPDENDGEAEAEALEVVEKAKTQGILGTIAQAFGLTFLAEWGDRTQITTIALAASNNQIGVTSGAILGHSIAAAIAVIGGRLIAGHISEKKITLLGGLLFLIFGVVAGFER